MQLDVDVQAAPTFVLPSNATLQGKAAVAVRGILFPR